MVAYTNKDGKMVVYTIVDNPAGCWKAEGEKPASCKACHHSHVNEKNQWTGSQRCWNAQCLVAAPKKDGE